jgi:hypothetical protein
MQIECLQDLPAGDSKVDILHRRAAVPINNYMSQCMGAEGSNTALTGKTVLFALNCLEWLADTTVTP